jgi:hypothetical protein
VIRLKANKPRFIRAKHPQLRRIRAKMRLILRKAFNDQYVKLLNQASDVRSNAIFSSFEKDRKEEELYVKASSLIQAYREAPLGCGVCGTHAIEDDLKYNEYNHEWFCEVCYTENQEYYKKNPHPWLPCWKKLYP